MAVGEPAELASEGRRQVSPGAADTDLALANCPPYSDYPTSSSTMSNSDSDDEMPP
jgi:hypothetical protein